jgi:ribA/ribD-fused uncharacterized protein
MEAIREFSGVHRWLSNFWPCQVTFGFIHFGSVENAYQAAKCNEPDDMMRFVNITAGQAKRLGRQIEMRPDFDVVKLAIMEYLVRQKMYQNPFKDMLIATGHAIIEEGNTWGDKFWGVDLRTGVGENHLGIIIMNIRAELNPECYPVLPKTIYDEMADRECDAWERKYGSK